ncbi:hypothetical protein ACN47E_006016 [Coniothyrium glycines]
MPTYEELLAAMLRNPPDPNEPQPLSNRKETIYGATIAFLALSWMAVLFRLWVRFRILREPGWDDFFVLVSAIINTVATVCVCFSVEHGLGRHMLYLPPKDMESYFFFFWLEHCLYMTETTTIKISLLLQYLRIFRAGTMRWICISLIIIVTMWGIGFSFSGWFACTPVRGAWDRVIPSKCFGFGLGNVDDFIAMFRAHSTTNMTFDIIIFLAPMVLFRTPNLRRNNVIAMGGMFTFGALVIAAAVWRLYGITSTQAATYPYMDFTWWSPTMIVLSCLEIDLAVICASMPIFWPVIERSLAAIFVSFEVQVVEERVDGHGLAYDLEHMKVATASIKSSGMSTHELMADDYSDDVRRVFTVGADPLNYDANMSGLRTDIQSKPKPRWEL